MNDHKSSKISWKAINKPPKGHTKNRPFVFCTISKDGICHIISSILESSEQVRFDSDESSATVDKYDNARICSEEDVFTYNIEPIIYNRVATIGGNDLITKVIGIVSWSWTDDEGKLQTNKLNNVIYFPESPVNILSATALYEPMKYDEGTWVLTKQKYYIFTWNFCKYKKTIANS